MKRKTYFNFAIGRLIAGLVTGAVIFGITSASLTNLYDSAVSAGFTNHQQTYKKIIENYAKGTYDEVFIEVITNFYYADYIRFAKINEDGSIEPVYETDYRIVPVEQDIHHWYDITDDESLLAQDKKILKLNDTDWVIEYKKCDEAWELGEVVDPKYTNSWDLCAVSESLDGAYYSNKVFRVATELSGYLQYGQPVVKTYYVDGDTLHIGKVEQVGMILESSKPFGKKWDFTDPARASLYGTTDQNGIASDLYVFRKSVRPDAFFNDLGKIFLADNLNDLTSEYDSRFGPDSSWVPGYEAYGGPDRTHEDEYSYSVTTRSGDHTTRGIIDVYSINGQQYMVEFVVTTLPFMTFYKPFFTILAVVLFILCAGIALLTAVRPYTQYRKAYENNVFKNNLIDSLAHNMKTPLQILGGYAENLKDVKSGDEKDRYADQILAKTGEMNRDIEAILKTAEKSDRKFTKASVKTCFEEAASGLGADIEINGDAMIKMDKDYFKTALSCLIDNAGKYRTGGTKTEVNITAKEITVRNKTGADSFTPGTGIAIAGRILEQHGLKLKTAIKGGSFEAKISRK